MRFSIRRGGDAPKLDGSTWVYAEGDDLIQPVWVRLGLGDDERLVATGLLIESDSELTSRAIRLPLRSIVAEFSLAASEPQTLKRLFLELLGIRLAFSGDEPTVLPGAWTGLLPTTSKKTPTPRARPGRRGNPDSHFQDFAKVYGRAKEEHPRRPIRAVMAELGVAESTVHRWKGIAIKRGFLDDGS